MQLTGRIETLPEEDRSYFLEVIHIVVIITNSHVNTLSYAIELLKWGEIKMGWCG